MNEYFVGAQGDRLVVANLPKLAAGLTPEQAVNLAAWLVVMAEAVMLIRPGLPDIRKLLDDAIRQARS